MARRLRLLGAAVIAAGAAALVTMTAHAATVQVLSREELADEMRFNPDLHVQVEHSGYPDLAQRWQVHSNLPWATYLVRVIYLDAGKEVGFSRAYLLGSMQYGLLRYRRPLSDELAEQTRQFLATAAPIPAMGLGEPGDAVSAAERAEMAANRADQAAAASERGAEMVEATAQRLDEMATQAEASFRKQMRK